MELKRKKTNYFIIAFGFQSNQSGIETVIVEIIRVPVVFFQSNQSGIETKYEYALKYARFFFQSNQSGIETPNDVALFV